MADDGSLQSKTLWPLPKFSFQVQWGSVVTIFQEVSGLSAETQIMEYRHAKSTFSAIKMPGIKKPENVTLKKGVIQSDSPFWDWFINIKTNTITRVPVTISLLDENGKVMMAWTLDNAWPIKITYTDLKTQANEVAVETLELAHEGLTLVTF